MYCVEACPDNVQSSSKWRPCSVKGSCSKGLISLRTLDRKALRVPIFAEATVWPPWHAKATTAPGPREYEAQIVADEVPESICVGFVGFISV